MFSVVAIFKARLIRELGNALGLGPSKSSLASDAAVNAEIPAHELKAAKVAEFVAGGNWMWVLARSVEKIQPLNIYAYAARSKDKWHFDLHVGEKGALPRIGWAAPHIYVPMSELVIAVYNECRNIAGVTDEDTKGGDA